MKNLIVSISFLITISYVHAQDLGAPWGVGGKYEKIGFEDRDVIKNYALTNTEYFKNIAQRQKTALQKLTSEILSMEDLPADVDYSSIIGEVTLKTGAGFLDNIKEKALNSIPVIGAIVDLGIQSYKEHEENIERTRQINSKNGLVAAINELADQIDDMYADKFTVKTMNMIADDFLPVNLTSTGTDYLKDLDLATNTFFSSVPTSDQIYISTLENLLNFLNTKNSKYGLIRIGIDYRNIAGLESALKDDFLRKPYNVSIRIVDGPYKARVMNAMNSFIDKSNFSVLKLKVNKYVICHLKAKGSGGTVKIGTIKPDYSFISAFDQNNPEIIIDYYYEGQDPTEKGRSIGGIHIPPLAKFKYNDLNGGGAPAVTTYSELLHAAYVNVWSNSQIYKKFNP